VDAVRLSFPETTQGDYLSVHILEQFLQFNKLPSYKLNFEVTLNGKPDTGDYEITLSSFMLDQLGTFSGILDLSGLTQNKIKELTNLSGKPFLERINTLILNRFVINYVDNSFVNKLFEFNSEEFGVPVSELKDQSIRIFEGWLDTYPFLDSKSNLVTGFTRFVQNPLSLTFDMTPKIPVTLKTKATYDDEDVFYNDLNMTLRFNQGGLSPIIFITSDKVEDETEETNEETNEDTNEEPKDTEVPEESTNPDAQEENVAPN
jgi:hypothetical protein